MSLNIRHFLCLLLVLCFTGTASISAFGQDKKPPKQPKVKEGMPTPGADPPGYFNGDGFTSERSIIVDPEVTIKLPCVSKDIVVTVPLHGYQLCSCTN